MTTFHDMDISALSLVELKNLQKQLPQLIAQKQSEAFEAARKALEETAAKYGFSLSDFANAKTVGKKRVAPVYRHLTDASLTWTGRGRKPVWVQEHLNAGGSLDQLRIA